MKKKLLALLMSVFMAFGITTFSACDMSVITDTFDIMIENEQLKLENDALAQENAELRQELFEAR